MSFNQIVTLEIRPGTADAFESAFAELTKVVAQSEPDTLTYTLYRSRDNANSYKVIESYTDEAALELHMANLSKREQMATIGGSLAGAPTVEVLDSI